MYENALIIVDMVYDFTNPNGKVFYPYTQELIAPLNNFISVARKNNVQIIFIEHTVSKETIKTFKVSIRECCIEGSGGEKTDVRLNQQKNDIYIKKTKYSAFFKTSLEQNLKKLGVNNLFIVGTKTNNCILATAFDAYYRDFNTYVIKDLVATSSENLNNIYLNDINKYVAHVISMDEAIKLLEKAKQQ